MNLTLEKASIFMLRMAMIILTASAFVGVIKVIYEGKFALSILGFSVFCLTISMTLFVLRKDFI